MLSLDEVIANKREKAKEQRSHIGTWNEEYSQKCEEWAKDHEQLAEWLEELKAIKSDGFTDDLLNMGFSKGYGKALDDFAKALLSNPVVDKSVVRRVAEQLRAGENNYD